MLTRETVMVPTTLGPVAVHRAGSGPAVVVLHANPGNSRDFDAVTPALAAEFTVHAIDWPGYGDSPAPAQPRSATAVSYADLLPEIIEQLGLEHAAFVGNSLGGFAAIRFVLQQPSRVKALILINSGGFTRHTWFTQAFSRIKGTELMTRALVSLFPRWYLRRRTTIIQAMLARATARRHNRPSLQVEAAIWRSFTSPEYDLRPHLSTLDKPTLLAWGTKDPLLGSDGQCARRLIPHATWHPFITGHAPYAEAPEEFLAVVLPFLRDHLR